MNGRNESYWMGKNVYKLDNNVILYIYIYVCVMNNEFGDSSIPN